MIHSSPIFSIHFGQQTEATHAMGVCRLVRQNEQNMAYTYIFTRRMDQRCEREKQTTKKQRIPWASHSLTHSLTHSLSPSLFSCSNQLLLSFFVSKKDWVGEWKKESKSAKKKEEEGKKERRKERKKKKGKPPRSHVAKKTREMPEIPSAFRTPLQFTISREETNERDYSPPKETIRLQLVSLCANRQDRLCVNRSIAHHHQPPPSSFPVLCCSMADWVLLLLLFLLSNQIKSKEKKRGRKKKDWKLAERWLNERSVVCA